MLRLFAQFVMIVCGVLVLYLFAYEYLVAFEVGIIPDLRAIAIIPRILGTYGDFVAIIVAGVMVFYEIRNENKRVKAKSDEDELRRKRTARYWVFYNASNRVTQDFSVLREIYASQQDFADETDKAREQAHFERVLKGFRATWQNDDVLNEAISFEFSLLTRVEKRAILEYFANYNEFEDHISLQIPILRSASVEAGNDAPAVETISARPTTPEEFNVLINDIYERLGELISEGIQLMKLLSDIDEFPGFQTRMETYIAATKNRDREGGEAPPEKRIPHDLKLLTTDKYVECLGLGEEGAKELKLEQADMERINAERRKALKARKLPRRRRAAHTTA